MAEEKAEKKAAPAKKAKRAIEPPRSEKKCREEGCKVPYKAKGYCVKHYRLWRQHNLGRARQGGRCGWLRCRRCRYLRGRDRRDWGRRCPVEIAWYKGCPKRPHGYQAQRRHDHHESAPEPATLPTQPWWFVGYFFAV